MSGPRPGWRLALRLAWREALRAPARTTLTLVMIALPVMATVAADVVYTTSNVSSVEGLDRQLGTAQASVRSIGGNRAYQAPDPDDGIGSSGTRHHVHVTEAVQQVLGDVPTTPLVSGLGRVRTERGSLNVQLLELDARSPLTQGLFTLTSGRMPERPGEVALNPGLADGRFAVGDRLTVAGTTATVVGIARDAQTRTDGRLYAVPGGVPVRAATRSVLVGGDPVSWSQVLAFNRLGSVVLSRSVIEHPPPADQLPPMFAQQESQLAGALLAIVALVVVMALLEVVLLAGPAFAVGARRQSRSLALMAASGAVPSQGRRVVLASGIVLGSLASVAGVLLGLLLAVAALPLVQDHSPSWLGPFDVRPVHLLGIAAFGLLSAFLAAVVPAWIASRQDPVAVLAGRRSDRPAGLRSPLLGIVLLGIGVAMSAYGAHAVSQTGALLIAGSAIVAVLGMILLVPITVVGLSRLARRLPLTLRYAARDAARHRTRTVPAVAAVAACVAGVVTLGIGQASQAASDEAQYTPRIPVGTAGVSSWRGNPDWDAVRQVLSTTAPDAHFEPVVGLAGARSHVAVRIPTMSYVPVWSDSTLGWRVLVSGPTLDGVAGQIVGPSGRAAASRALASGGVVVVVSDRVDADSVVLSRHHQKLRLPAAYVYRNGPSTAQVIASPQVAARLGVTPTTVGLYAASGTITKDQEAAATEELGRLKHVSLYVERGFERDTTTVIVLLILAALGAVLMIGGTLTATFLALSDARPDLATLAAVGAAPRSRRRVAAAYAMVIGGVGAVLGLLVGFIPGIAITYPLTGSAWDPRSTLPGHVVAVPWGLLGFLVVALPLGIALVVGLTARSRLPLVARLD